MEPGRQDDAVASRDGVTVHSLADAADVRAVLGFLDAVGSVTEAPLVDEAERRRLVERATGEDLPGHHAALARRDGEPVGYVGLTVEGRLAAGDVAVPPGDRAAVGLRACLDAAEELARRAGAERLEAWLRQADAAGVDRAVGRGYEVARRLAVLGRPLPDTPRVVPAPDGITIRAYRPGEDDAAVVGVLAEAYADTSEAGWDLERLRERRGYDWFDPRDLLLAADAEGSVLGLHWTKRRSDTVGEVYNLAVAPRAQGRRLGAALLTSGLRHLHDRGARDVLLWVDTANGRAVALYRAHGFEPRWEDVALTRELA